MRDGLIAPMGDVRRRFGKLRGGDGDEIVPIACGGCCCFLCFCWLFFISSLSPNEWGLMRNYMSGTIEYKAYRGGVFLTGPLKGFMKFPATQVTLEFSSHNYKVGLIEARTGATEDDENSGGQPISISCAFQYSFLPEKLPQVYLDFGSYDLATIRFYQLSKMAVSSTAQHFSPQDFWSKREEISTAMLKAINKTLMDDGHVEAVRFQILKVDFQPLYEESITAIQVAEQQRVVNEADQKVKEVEMTIAVMEATNNATITNISAGADADAKYKVALAKKGAFTMTQDSKAENYAKLKDKLGFQGDDIREYFKIKAIQAKGKAGSTIIVGMANPGFEEGPMEL